MNQLQRLIRILPFLLFTFLVGPVFGQANADVEMADALRQNGKIYVVVASVLLLVLGLVFFLFVLERRVQRLEKQKQGKS